MQLGGTRKILYPDMDEADVLALLDAMPLMALQKRSAPADAAEACAPLADAAEDLELVAVVLPEADKKIKWVKGSGQLMAYARSKKTLVRTKKQLNILKDVTRTKEQQIAVAALISSDAARAVGYRLNRGYRAVPPHLVAPILMRLAFSRRVRSNNAMAKRQNRAVGHVLRVLVPLQTKAFWNLGISAAGAGVPPGTSSASAIDDLAGPAASTGGEATRPPPVLVRVIAHQFDTSKQRMKEVSVRSVAGTARGTADVTSSGTHAYVTSTVLMQRLQTHVCFFSKEHPQGLFEEQPFLMRGICLNDGNANFYLEGVLRRLPFDLEKKEHLDRLGTSADFVWMIWTLDRDINNALVVSWIFARLEACTPKQVLPLSLPCLVHGVQLVKERYSRSKPCMTQCASLAKQFKHHSFRKGARAALRAHVIKNCRVRFCKRPRAVLSLGDSILRLLCPEKDYSSYYDGFAVPGQKLEGSSVYRSTCAVLKCFDILTRADGSMELVFCYWAGEDKGSADAADLVDPDQPIQSCSDKGREKVADIMLEYALGVAWKVAALNRWGYVDIVARRVALLSIMDNSLMAMLEGIRRGAGLELNLEAALARQVAATPDDISKKNQLKVVRLCRILGTADARLHVALTLLASGLLHELFYHLVGCQDKGHVVKAPATLRALVHPEDSAIGYLQQEIIRLLDGFGNDHSESQNWLLLSIIGVDCKSPEVRVQARASLIRMHTGLIHHFCKLLGSAPYCLLLTLPEMPLPQEEKLRIAANFVRTPRACLNLSAQRMQEGCQRAADVFQLACPLRALGERALTSVAAVERDHSQVRKDLSSVTSASEIASSLDRVLCRQARSAHVDRGGAEPADAPLPCSAVGKAGGNAHPGSVYIRYINRQMEDFKKAVAPDRPLTSPEMEFVRGRADADFRETSSLPEWSRFNSVKSRQSKRERGQATWPAESPAEPPKVFKPLWGQDEGRELKRQLLSPSHMEQLRANVMDAGSSSAAAAGDEPHQEIFVDSPVPERCTAKGDGWNPLWGCSCRVKNVCRKHVDEDKFLRRRLDTTLLHRINHWVRHVGREKVDGVNEFVLFTTTQRACDGGSLDRICLLSDAVFSPVAQYFTYCHLPILPGEVPKCRFDYPQVPFKLRIGVESRCFRMRGTWETLWTRTSDELAMDLLRDAGPDDWRLVPLRCEPDCESDSLLNCRVLALEPEVPRPAPNKKLEKNEQHELEREVLALLQPCSDAAARGAHDEADLLNIDDSDPGEGEPLETDSDWEAAFDEVAATQAAHVEGFEPELELLDDAAGDPAPADASADAAGDPAPADASADAAGDPAPADASADAATPDAKRAREAATKRAAPGQNDIPIGEFKGWILNERGIMAGYSIECPNCLVRKNLNWVKSGMQEEEARRRLQHWAKDCKPSHQDFGGKLLKDYASS